MRLNTKSAGGSRGFLIVVYWDGMRGKQKYDFIAIGDTVTDAFIKLKDAHVSLNQNEREICMRFGDKIPYEEVYVVPRSAMPRTPHPVPLAWD